jgi:predicted esterase
MSAGSRAQRRTFEYGRTHVVKPKGKHQATIVWLHGLGDNGSRYLHWTIHSLWRLIGNYDQLVPLSD